MGADLVAPAGSFGGMTSDTESRGRHRPGWLAGSIPFSNIAAAIRAGVDLRDGAAGLCRAPLQGWRGSAACSRRDLRHRQGRRRSGAGRAGLADAGLHGRRRLRRGAQLVPGLGAGGGISVAMGSLLVQGWPGTGFGVGAGRWAFVPPDLFGSFVADLALVPGWRGPGAGRHARRRGRGRVMLAKRIGWAIGPRHGRAPTCTFTGSCTTSTCAGATTA